MFYVDFVIGEVIVYVGYVGLFFINYKFKKLW